MYKVKSIDSFVVKGRGTVLCIESPVDCQRNIQSFFEAVGGEIEIDGVVYEPSGIEMFMIGTPLSKGESIGILIG